MKHVASGILVLLGATLGAQAAPFVDPGHLVVMRCTDGYGAEAIYLDEYDVAGATPVLVQTIPLPSAGSDAFTTPGLTSHDRHLHRSMDGRFVAFVGYNKPYVAGSIDDPSAEAASTTPRVVALLKFDGTLNLTTRITDAFDYTALRAATTTDGDRIWLAGDNASGATASGGTRFTTRGSSTTVNLSQVQVFGGFKTPDNVRDIAVFGSQLFNSSGSSSSIGKALFRVGSGLPESGSQAVTTLTTDNASVSSFYFVDADPAVAGFDTVYTGTSTGSTLRKYNLVGGSWVSRGLIVGSADVEQVAVTVDGECHAIIYAETSGNIYRIVDTAPYGGTISGGFGAPYIVPAAGYTLGGVEFAPGAWPCDLNRDGEQDGSDLAVFISCAGGRGLPYKAGCPLEVDTESKLSIDYDRDGDVDMDDFGVYQRCIGRHELATTSGCGH